MSVISAIHLGAGRMGGGRLPPSPKNAARIRFAAMGAARRELPPTSLH